MSRVLGRALKEEEGGAGEERAIEFAAVNAVVGDVAGSEGCMAADGLFFADWRLFGRHFSRKCGNNLATRAAQNIYLALSTMLPSVA